MTSAEQIMAEALATALAKIVAAVPGAAVSQHDGIRAIVSLPGMTTASGREIPGGELRIEMATYGIAPDLRAKARWVVTGRASSAQLARDAVRVAFGAQEEYISRAQQRALAYLEGDERALGGGGNAH